MKKMFILSAFVTLPLYADPDIGYANNVYTSNGAGMCVYSVLDTYAGDANLRAEWQRNQIRLRWFNNNTQIIPSNDTANTCNYDSTLTVPSNTPSRTGYAFAGWRVRETMNFSSLSLSTGTVAYGKGTNGIDSNTSICYWFNPTESENWQGGSNAACKTNSNFTELENHEWKTEYTSGTSKGTLYGMAHCSKKPGDRHDYTWPVASRSDWETATVAELDAYSSNEEAKYCWCKATGWKAEGQTSVKGSLSPLAWVFIGDAGSASNCTAHCAYYCASNARNNSAFRAALFLGADNAD